MSGVTCEKCGRPGARRIGHVAPEGWFFGSFTFDSTGDHDPGDLLIVHACSEECRDALWTKQDGHRWDFIERRVNVAEELRRAASVHAEKLRATAKAMTDTLYPTGEDGTCSAAEIFARILEEAAEQLVLSTETEVEILSRGGNTNAGGA